MPTPSQKRKRSYSMEMSSTQDSQLVRNAKRRKLIPRPARNMMKIKRVFDAGLLISTDGINPFLEAINFSINDMPGYTELSALFEFYKITGVKVRAHPYYQDASISNATINNVRQAPIYYVIDRNDAIAPTAVSQLLEYDDVKQATVFTGFTCWIPNPKFADATSAQRGGWVSTVNVSLNWFGLKIAIPPTGATCQMYVTVTFYVDLKGVK